MRPFKRLIRYFKGLIRPSKSLIMTDRDLQKQQNAEENDSLLKQDEVIPRYLFLVHHLAFKELHGPNKRHKAFIRPFKGLIRPLMDLIRPLKDLIRPFKGFYMALGAFQISPE